MFGWLDRDKILFCKISKIWAEWMILSTGIHYDVIGLDNLLINKQYVFMSNHESALDILLGVVAIPNKIVFLAKKELFKIPVFGWAMKAAGMIKIDRQNSAIARQSVDNAVDVLVNSRFSTLIYPEGTRSQSGELLPFKKGGFILAIRSQLPIVPVTIVGTGKALPKGKFNIRRTRIIVVIDKPITTYGMNINDREELLQNCRTVIMQNLNNLNHNRNAKYKLYSA